MYSLVQKSEELYEIVSDSLCVKDLIEILQTIDPNLPITCGDYEIRAMYVYPDICEIWG